MSLINLKSFCQQTNQTFIKIAKDYRRFLKQVDIMFESLTIGGRNILCEKKCLEEKRFGYLGEQGEIITDDNYIYTDYIPVYDYEYITIKLWGSSNRNFRASLSYYQSNKEYAGSRTLPSDSYSVNTFNIPGVAYFVRISVPHPRFQVKYKVEFGDKATDYTPALEDYPYLNQKIYDKETLNWNFHPKTDVISFLAVKDGGLIIITATIDIKNAEEKDVITLFKVPEELKGKTDLNQLINVVRMSTSMGNKSTLRELDYFCDNGSVTISNTKFEGVYDSFNDFKNSTVQITLTYPCLKI